jgi:RNase adaptor protein for sRNA GlmZ degradation
MSKRVKLVYEFYENENAYYGFEITDEIGKDYNKEILDVEDITYDKNRKLIIYSWGIIKHEEPKCELSFDLTKFTTKTDNKDIKSLDGRDDEIQISIIRHPLFKELIKKIINEIEENNYMEISFFCNHGKHRSVGWAEILKKHYYENSVIKHVRFN